MKVTAPLRLRHAAAALAASVLAATGTAPASALAPAAPAPSRAPKTPRTVSIVMVPALAGVHFVLDGVAGVTGPTGTATASDQNLSETAARLDVPQQNLGSNLRVELDRVATDPNHGAFSRRLVAELDEDRAVTIHLVTARRNPLPLDQVSAVTLVDSLGRTTRLSRAQLAAPLWLAASRPTQVAKGVASRQVTYAFASVMVHGSNVVNDAQLRFTPNQSPVWTVPGIFYSLTVRANDLLGGKPAGSSARLTYPDMGTRTVQLGAGHQVTLTDLPRGDYQVQVNSGVVSLASSVRLSRDQTATLVVVTAGDVSLLGAGGLAVAGILIAAGVLGRRRRRRAVFHEGRLGAAVAA